MSIAKQDPATDMTLAVDPYGREVSSIRISITQRCDLGCPHCHREGQTPASDEMSPREIEEIVALASSMGVRKVKLTGGEPLMREDVANIVSRVSPLVSEVSMTTNGSRLEALAKDLKRSGLRRVNVSLHSLRGEVCERLCGVDVADRAVRGIRRAVTEGLNPVKVNMVVVKGENDGDIPSMIEFCSEVGAILQLIEYVYNQAGDNGCDHSGRYHSLESVERMLSQRAVEITINELHRRRRYHIEENGRAVTVEVVRPMHNTEFCSNCTRIRVSSDGKLKPCLMDPSGAVDILTPLREGADAETLQRIFLEAVSHRRPYWS